MCSDLHDHVLSRPNLERPASCPNDFYPFQQTFRNQQQSREYRGQTALGPPARSRDSGSRDERVEFRRGIIPLIYDWGLCCAHRRFLYCTQVPRLWGHKMHMNSGKRPWQRFVSKLMSYVTCTILWDLATSRLYVQ